MLNRTIIGATLFVVASLLSSSNASAQDAGTATLREPVTVMGITAPSERLKLAIPVPGIVLERKVRAGDVVKKDQVLLQLDDRIEQKALDSLNKEAKSTYQVAAAAADLELRVVQLERKEKMLQQMVVGLSEVEEARLQVKIGKIRQDLQTQELEIKNIERDRQELKVGMMVLKSPIDGEVEAIDVGPGEWADPQKPEGLVTVVKNNPLWVEVHLPTAQAQSLDRKRPLVVTTVGDTKGVEAKIIFVTPRADAASGTQMIRLEMPNANNRASGLQVNVTLPENVAAVAEGR